MKLIYFSLQYIQKYLYNELDYLLTFARFPLLYIDAADMHDLGNVLVLNIKK